VYPIDNRKRKRVKNVTTNSTPGYYYITKKNNYNKVHNEESPKKVIGKQKDLKLTSK
jgi:hypothetical protein